MALTKVTYSMIDGTTINATDYGVSTSATGSANTTAFNLALTAASGKTLYIPAGVYTISGGLTASANTTIVGYGATIQNTSSAVALLTLASNCSVFGLSFVGNSSTYDNNGNGIYVSGTRNGAGIAPTYVENITIKDCNFSTIAGYGIQTLFTKNVTIVNNTMYNIGYSGVMAYSCQNVLVDSNTIDTLTGETYSGELNAYGVSFTSLSNATDFVRDPQSTQCRATNNLIKNIPTWHGLDTHGGTYCEFIDNELIDCRRGVILTNLGTRGASNCVVQGNSYSNTLTGTNSNGTQKRAEAFWDIGNASHPNYYNTIKNNQAIAAGDPVNTSASIWIQNAEDGEVSGNFILYSYNYGILLEENVQRYGIRNNNIIDVQSDGTVTNYPACIYFHTDNWKLVDVSQNVLGRKATSVNTYVSVFGIAIANTSNKSISFYSNGFNNVSTPFFIPETTGLLGDIVSSYTGTLTGLTTSPTANVEYSISNNIASITIFTGVTGTSNASTLTITGAPGCLIPFESRSCLTRVIDNGTTYIGNVAISSSDASLIFSKDVGVNAFTTSGTKGIPSITFTYPIR